MKRTRKQRAIRWSQLLCSGGLVGLCLPATQASATTEPQQTAPTAVMAEGLSADETVPDFEAATSGTAELAALAASNESNETDSDRVLLSTPEPDASQPVTDEVPGTDKPDAALVSFFGRSSTSMPLSDPRVSSSAKPPFSDTLTPTETGRPQFSPLAQVSPPEPPEIPPLPPETPVEPTEPPPPEEPVEPTPPAPPAADEPRVEVVDIQVIGSTVFDDDDFDPVLAEFEGRQLTLEELRQAADAITQLYLNNGYITSRAILANQTVTDGVVQLQVIEGVLADIQIDGAPRLQQYVRDRIALGGGTPLSQIDLENQLRLLRADPLIDNIEASLRAGEGLGESLLLVRVTAAKTFEANLILDTSSPTSVGVVRTGAEAVYRNPLGYGDQLSGSFYRATTGGSYLYNLTYKAPINPMNGTITARYLPSNFRIVDPPSIAALDVRGSSDVYDLTYRQPLIRTPQEELALSLGFRYRSGRTLISTGFTIDESRTSVIQFGQDYLRRDPQGAWALRSQFSLGTGLFDATSRPSPLPDGQFFSWLGQVQRAQVLNPDNLLIIQADVQLSANSLLGSEQFVIGGPQSVRGYNQNARFGDNGFRFSVEDRFVIQRDESGAPLLQVAPFVDMAAVWNTENDTTNDRNFLLGTGVGLLYQPIEPFDIRLDLGVPIVNLDEPGDNPQDVFLYLLLNYAL